MQNNVKEIYVLVVDVLNKFGSLYICDQSFDNDLSKPLKEICKEHSHTAETIQKICDSDNQDIPTWQAVFEYEKDFIYLHYNRSAFIVKTFHNNLTSCTKHSLHLLKDWTCGILLETFIPDEMDNDSYIDNTVHSFEYAMTLCNGTVNDADSLNMQKENHHPVWVLSVGVISTMFSIGLVWCHRKELMELFYTSYHSAADWMSSKWPSITRNDNEFQRNLVGQNNDVFHEDESIV